MTGGMWPERLDAALCGGEPGQRGIASGDARRGAARWSAPLGRAGGTELRTEAGARGSLWFRRSVEPLPLPGGKVVRESAGLSPHLHNGVLRGASPRTAGAAAPTAPGAGGTGARAGVQPR